MKSKNDRLELAVIVSILLHALLIGLLILGSFFTKTTLEEAAGGSGGSGEEFEAVMVDTGQVAAEYGRLKSDKKGNAKPKVEEKEEPKPEEEVAEEEPTPQEIAEEQAKEQQRVAMIGVQKLPVELPDP